MGGYIRCLLGPPLHWEDEKETFCRRDSPPKECFVWPLSLAKQCLSGKVLAYSKIATGFFHRATWPSPTLGESMPNLTQSHTSRLWFPVCVTEDTMEGLNFWSLTSQLRCHGEARAGSPSLSSNRQTLHPKATLTGPWPPTIPVIFPQA